MYLYVYIHSYLFQTRYLPFIMYQSFLSITLRPPSPSQKTLVLVGGGVSRRTWELRRTRNQLLERRRRTRQPIASQCWCFYQLFRQSRTNLSCGWSAVSWLLFSISLTLFSSVVFSECDRINLWYGKKTGKICFRRFNSTLVLTWV